MSPLPAVHSQIEATKACPTKHLPSLAMQTAMTVDVGPIPDAKIISFSLPNVILADIGNFNPEAFNISSEITSCKCLTCQAMNPKVDVNNTSI